MIQLQSEKKSEIDRKNVKRQLQTLETRIQENLDLTKKQHNEVIERMQSLQEEPEDEEDDGAERTLATNEVEERLRLLEASQASCGMMFAQVRSERSGQDISDVVTSNNSRAFVGLPESVVGNIDQKIRGVRTEGGSVAVVGVYSGNMNF